MNLRIAIVGRRKSSMFEAKSDSVGIDLHVKIGGKTGLWVEPTELTKEGFVSSVGCQ